MRQRIEMADVVAFELETRPVALSQIPQDPFDILECIPEYEVAAAFEMLRFPVVFEALVTVQHREQAEVHRPHVERGHLRARPQGCGKPLLESHAMAAT